MKNPLTLKREILAGKFGLNYILKRDMGDTNDIPILPRLLYDIDNGDYKLLKLFAQKRYRELIAVPITTISMDLASGFNCWNTPGSINRFIADEDVTNDTLIYPKFKFIPLHQQLNFK